MQHDSELPNPTYVCTFASSKVGNSEFRDMYNEEINQTSYEAYLDIIPFLPPSTSMMDSLDNEMEGVLDGILWSDNSIIHKKSHIWDYETVGDRRFIDENGKIIDVVTKEIDKKRIKDIEKNLRSTKGYACSDFKF